MWMDSRDGPHGKSSAVDGDVVRQVGKRLARVICIAGRSLDARKLNSKGSPGFLLELRRGGVKGYRPRVHIGVVRVRADAVALAAVGTPLDVVEVPRDVASADVEVHTVGKVLGEIVDCPIETVLLRLVGACGVTLIAVTELATAPIGSPDAPELGAGGLGSPCCRGRGCRVGPDGDVILDILAKDPGAVNGETVSTGRDARDGNFAAAADLGPVLSGFGVQVVVLEVPSVAGQDCHGFRDACWETDAARPSAPAR